MCHGYEEEKSPDAAEFSKERENESLDNKLNDAIQRHDDADALDRNAKTSTHWSGGKFERIEIGISAFVLEENREQVVVGHLGLLVQL
jgi:hypothetical protein